jgi:hypothetical protein
MTTLKLDLEPFEIDSGDNELLDEQTDFGSEFNYELDLDAFEADVSDLEGERESRRPRRRSSRPAPRRPQPARPRQPVSIKRRRRSFAVREPSASCTCPAHSTEFVRWVQSALNQLMGLNLSPFNMCR